MSNLSERVGNLLSKIVGNSPKLTGESVAEQPVKFWSAHHNGVQYDFTVRDDSTEAEFNAWFEGYTAHALSCVSCQRLLFPGDIVGAGGYDDEGNGGGYVHYTDECSMPGTFVGTIDVNGQLQPAFPGGQSAIGMAYNSGESVSQGVIASVNSETGETSVTTF